MDARNVKEILQAAAAELARFEQELQPLVEQVKPIGEAANTAHNYGLQPNQFAGLSAEEIIEHFAGKVHLAAPKVELVPSVLSAGAPREIARAAEEVLALHRALGATIGRLSGILMGLA